MSAGPAAALYIEAILAPPGKPIRMNLAILQVPKDGYETKVFPDEFVQ